jgi:flagellar basal-body rod modification protein FlgD
MQVNATSDIYYHGQIKRSTGNQLDKNAFLQILAAQLSHQDPLSSQDSSAYVSQMAQFSALEQMQNLNKAFDAIFFLEAGGLIGRNITIINESGEEITGMVQKVRMGDNGAKVMMNDIFYGLEQIIQVE